ncbi:nucleopolyhedrovirus P10 family protein [Streptomyces sp. 15-116A]|uniref:nucleopolyhedrovirus P10 family protein n=1 Tax=Streptomyces sp. 15-116A TaxID=2259035 RepID=UPI0021B2E90B|nr:nucleopolyhedrovirus P10 family protein [Streptomyces sp. 15-116A]MCT7352280.1 nucleopolyhedrovirus P10 family protein [Streptomyces sp. 15-116A]
MTTADRWTQAVRRQLGLGRFLPLGGPRDGAWIAERAAEPVLRRAVAQGVPDVRLGSVRISLADPESASEPVVPPPPSALPPGPLRLTADFAATASTSEPLPTTAARLRTALAVAAAERLGLTVAEVDLRVTDLLEGAPEQQPSEEGTPDTAEKEAGPDAPADSDEGRVAAAALAVPGVSRLTGTLGRPVHLTERPATTTALPHRHARVDLAIRSDHRPLEVTRAVRTAVSETLQDHPTVSVLVTNLD